MPDPPPSLFRELLRVVAETGASDLHLSVGRVPLLRVDGILRPRSEHEPLSTAQVSDIIASILGPERHQAFFAQRRELDVAYEPAGLALRFRVNVFWSRGQPALVLRSIANEVHGLAELNLPASLLSLAEPRHGLVLLAAPSGHGKTTTMASMVDHINQTRDSHIITIEDPIEYIFREARSLIHQREVGADTQSFPTAIRAALREDPNVVVIGEMRDLETVAAALTVAETGHLVFGTIHTNDAAQTIDRMVDAFPADRRAEIRVQVAATLNGIVSQRLIPRVGGGRVPLVELLVATPAVRNLIREGETAQIPGVIQTGADYGMLSIDRSVDALLRSGLVTEQDIRPFLARTTFSGEWL